MKEYNNTSLRGKNERDVYTKVYDVRDTLFSYQTRKFPTQSRQGNKYVMVMVEIDSSGIQVLHQRIMQQTLQQHGTITTQEHHQPHNHTWRKNNERHH